MSTVPPVSGPAHGASASTTSSTSSKCTPSDVYSRPLVLSSSATYPAARARAVELHTSADSLTYAAGVTDAFQRHSSAPAAARPSLRSTIARMRGTAATTMSVSYNARKDRLTITAGAVRKVIPAVHEYMAELGLDDFSEVSIDDVRVVMDGTAVVAVDGVSFAAAQP